MQFVTIFFDSMKLSLSGVVKLVALLQTILLISQIPWIIQTLINFFGFSFGLNLKYIALSKMLF